MKFTGFNRRGFLALSVALSLCASPLAGPIVKGTRGGGGGGAGFVSWDAVTNATGYKVYWDTMGGPPYTNSADAGNVLTYTPAGLSSGVTYYVNVRAYDESGLEGAWGTQLQKVAP
jgi:hypothetical protein